MYAATSEWQTLCASQHPQGPTPHQNHRTFDHSCKITGCRPPTCGLRELRPSFVIGFNHQTTPHNDATKGETWRAPLGAERTWSKAITGKNKFGGFLMRSPCAQGCHCSCGSYGPSRSREYDARGAFVPLVWLVTRLFYGCSYTCVGPPNFSFGAVVIRFVLRLFLCASPVRQ